MICFSKFVIVDLDHIVSMNK